MITLGVDYGRAKIGLAIGTGIIAEPLKVVRVSSWEDILEQVEQVVQVEQVEQVVVGVSEKEMGDEQKKFARLLQKKLSVPVVTWDETLSTHDAQTKAIEAGLSRQKRKKMEDAYAAAVVLQSYLESKS